MTIFYVSLLSRMWSFLTKDNLSRLPDNIEHRVRMMLDLLCMIIALPSASHLSCNREPINACSSHKKKRMLCTKSNPFMDRIWEPAQNLSKIRNIL